MESRSTFGMGDCHDAGRIPSSFLSQVQQKPLPAACRTAAAMMSKMPQRVKSFR
jgi:hypothetical protein